MGNALKYDAPNTISAVFRGCKDKNPLAIDADDVQLYVNGIYVRPVGKQLYFSGNAWGTPSAPTISGTGSYYIQLIKQE